MRRRSSTCLLQEWQDGHFLERADSGAIAAVHDAALVHILVSRHWLLVLQHSECPFDVLHIHCILQDTCGQLHYLSRFATISVIRPNR